MKYFLHSQAVSMWPFLRLNSAQCSDRGWRCQRITRHATCDPHTFAMSRVLSCARPDSSVRSEYQAYSGSQQQTRQLDLRTRVRVTFPNTTPDLACALTPAHNNRLVN